MLCMRASQRQKVTHGPVSCHKRALSKQGASLCRPKDESVGPRAANRFGVTPPPPPTLVVCKFAVTSPVAVYSAPGSMLSLIWPAAFPHCNPDAALMAYLWPDDAAWTSAHRVPAAVSLPPIQDLLPIHDLDLGHNGGFHTSRPVLPGPARFSSQPLTPPATLLHPVSHSETQEACHKCGALQWSTQTECTNCGSIKFTHPFQRNLDSSFSSNGYDESMRNNTPMSRRDSGMGRGSVGSYSDNSNPSSRRSSTTAATHPSARRKTAKETRAKKTAEIKMEKSTDANKRINKAARERGSRRGLKIETKRLEIRQMMRGWTASTNLNQNNQNKSGLNGKKIETLRRTNNEGRERDLAMIEIYNDIRRLVTIARKPHEARSADDYAYLREQEYHAAEHSDVLRDIMQREDIEVAAFMENLNAEEDDEDGVSTRYQTPQSPEDSAYGGSPHSYAL
ncbi:hypothetical protein JOL62DRAFT_248368 [Phyllosticta paracitricarpa]|uniref:Uncharacterized protein n=1 Tax=Phyllosticta paracitricarpa TaxID=2016321 RepID=A0ABR1N2C1_9PEZI